MSDKEPEHLLVNNQINPILRSIRSLRQTLPAELTPTNGEKLAPEVMKAALDGVMKANEALHVIPLVSRYLQAHASHVIPDATFGEQSERTVVTTASGKPVVKCTIDTDPLVQVKSLTDISIGKGQVKFECRDVAHPDNKISGARPRINPPELGR